MAVSRHSGRHLYSDFGTMVRFRLEVHGIHHLSDISTTATSNMEPPSHIQIFCYRNTIYRPPFTFKSMNKREDKGVQYIYPLLLFEKKLHIPALIIITSLERIS